MTIRDMYELLSVIGVIIGIIMLYGVERFKPSDNQKNIALICCAGLAINFGNYFSMFSKDYQGLLHALQLQMAGHIFVLTSFILFMAGYCKINLKSHVKMLILFVNSIGICLCMTCSLHDLFYKEIKYISDVEHPYLMAEPGVYYILFRVVNIIYVIVLIGCIIYNGKKKTTKESAKNYFVIASTIAAVSGDLITELNIVPGYAFVSIGMTVSIVILAVAIYKFGVLDAIQVAKDSMLENATEGLVVVDTEKKLVYANEKAKEIFTYLDMSDHEYANGQLKDLFEGRLAVIRTPQGHYEAKISELKERGYVKGYMAWLFDLTFINKYTQEIIELKEYAEAANRSKSSFLANMSHEIRTPMNAIMGFNELVLQKAKDEEIKSYASDIKLASKNLLNLINGILDLSKIELGKLELTVKDYIVKNLIDESVVNVRSQAQNKGLKFIMDIDERLPYALNGDEDCIRNVLINLLNNAVKYTEEGFIKFVVKLEDESEDKARIRFMVADSGIGIRKEDIPNIFNKFEKFDSKKNSQVEGTGLGLTIVKNYVELMDGIIEVESEYGMGSMFSVVLTQNIVSDNSMVQNKNDTNEEHGKNRRKFKAPNARILITDDNAINLKVTASLLKSYGIKTELAESGRKAIELCRTNPYDIIFMDHMMPEMDGVEAMNRIRSLVDDDSYRSVIVALTANAISGVKEQMIKDGFDDYVSKPIDIAVMEDVLLKYLPEGLIIDVSDDTPNEEEDRYANDNKPVEVAVEKENTKDTISEAKGNNLEECLTGFDVEQGITNCGSDREAFVEVLQVYYESGEHRISDFNKFVSEKDYKNYIIAVHGLKSSSASIGALSFSERAKKHEFAGKEERYEFIHNDFEGLIAEYRDVLEKVRKGLVCEGVIEDKNEGVDSDNDTQNIRENTSYMVSKELEETIVKSLCDMLVQYDFSSMKRIIDYVEDMNLSTETREYMENLMNEINEGNIKAAFDMAARIRA